MSKFKVGDRVRLLRDNTNPRWGREGEEGTVMGVTVCDTDCCVDFDESGKWYAQWDDLEHVVAVAPATATLTIEAGKYYKTRDGRKVGPMAAQDGYHTVEGYHYAENGECCFYGESGNSPFPARDIIAEWVDEPAPAESTPIHVTLGIDLNPVVPQVGDAVLIKGTLAGITTSPRGTNYNIVFETQNRRVSLHFLEEDFIVDPDQDDGDCPCAAVNDNGPLPSGGDTAKAFDAFGSWIRSLAVARAA